MWAHMNRYQHGLGWPKGNTNWGKFHGDFANGSTKVSPMCGLDTRGTRLHELSPGQARSRGHSMVKSPGSGILSEIVEWTDLLIGTTADHTIDAEYPGAGHVLPTSNGNISALGRSSP